MFLRSGISHLHNCSSVPPALVHAIQGEKDSLQRSIDGNLALRDQFGRSPLTFAAMGDEQDSLELLLKSGFGVNNADSFGRTALHWAALKNSYRCVKLLLQHGADWAMKDKDGVAAIHLASKHCLPLILKYMRPEEINMLDNKKRTALHWSARSGNLNNIRLLIKHKCNIHLPDVDGKIATHMAASSKSPDAAMIVRVLLENYPSVLKWQDMHGRTALHFAIADGTFEVIKVLISMEDCNLNLADNKFRTPLHLAAMLGLPEIVKLLLVKGANGQCADFDGATAFHYAAFSGQLDVINIFVNEGLNIDYKDENGCTPLMWAAGKSDVVTILSLIQYDATLSATDKHGATSLHIAASTGRLEIVEIFLRSGALVDSTDALGRTPLFYACELGHSSCVVTFLQHGASITHVDGEGRTALHWAARGGHKGICEILICAGIGPNVCDLWGRTPLIHGIFSGNCNCVSLLVISGADPHHVDNQGFNALHWACRQGTLDTTEYLVRCKVNPNTLSKTEIGNNRCTALDLALLNESVEVARFILRHGGLSVIHIRNLAAIKIQAYFRGYRIRNLLSVSFLLDSFNRQSFPSNASQSMGSRESAFLLPFARDDDGTARRDTVFEAADNRGLCLNSFFVTDHSDDSFGSTGSGSDDKNNHFRHLEPSNNVKGVRVNRKVFHRSGTRDFSVQRSKSESNIATLTPPLPRDRTGSSVSLSTFSWLAATARHVLQKRRKRHQSLQQSSELLTPKLGLLERFRRFSRPEEPTAVIGDTVFPMVRRRTSSEGNYRFGSGDSPVSTGVRDRRRRSEGDEISKYSCESLQSSFSSSTGHSRDSSDLFEVPRWCTDRILCKVAENEWATALMNYSFERIPIQHLDNASSPNLTIRSTSL